MLEEEAQLVRQASAGDAAAFERLLEDALGRMLNVARRMLRDDDDAWDAAQDASLRAWRKIGEFRGDSRFSTWICGITVRLALDRIQARRTSTELDEDLPSVDSPPSDAENRALGDALEEAVSGLSAAERGVFVMHAYGGLRYREIALQLGIPIGTVMSRLNAARLKLRSRLEPWWKEENR